jgi:hypothetical protein
MVRRSFEDSRTFLELTKLEHLAIAGFSIGIGVASGLTTDHSWRGLKSGILYGLGYYGFNVICGVISAAFENSRGLYSDEDNGDWFLEP